MVITLQVAGDASTAGAPGVSRASAVTADIGRRFGVELRALHPESTDRTLGTYFIVEAPDGALGERLLEALRRSPLVAAAYVKPPDAMP